MNNMTESHLADVLKTRLDQPVGAMQVFFLSAIASGSFRTERQCSSPPSLPTYWAMEERKFNGWEEDPTALRVIQPMRQKF